MTAILEDALVRRIAVWDGTCLTCGHQSPHKRRGPIRDLNGFQHDDACEKCDCINDPSYDLTTRIRHSLDGHQAKPGIDSVFIGVRCADCGNTVREHLIQAAVA